jgi:hypothetical protein
MIFFFAGFILGSSISIILMSRTKHHRFKMRPEWYSGITSDDLINDRVMFFE